MAVDLACTNCGKNLRAQPIGGICPGCGHAVAKSAARFLPQLDHEGHIATDVPCVNCGYNLRTQPAGGICPECANPVVRSISGHYLHHAPPRWIRRLSDGARRMVMGIITGVVASLVLVVAGFMARPNFVSRADAALLVLGITVSVTSLWLVASGTWCLTTPEPIARFREKGLIARRLVRWCLLALPILIVLNLVAAVAWLSPLAPAFIGATALATIAYFLLPLATLRHIATLMRQVPRRGLVIFAKIEFWGLLIAGLFYFVSASTFAPVAAGPTMPVPTSATGPSFPTAVTTRSSPALTVLDYIPPPPANVTYAGPVSPLFFLVTAVMTVSGRCLVGISITGLVLLILVWRALAGAARLAEASALGEQTS